jgi:hypothetical protein
MGDLLDPAHPMVVAYGRFLLRYIRMITRLCFEIDHAHGRCMGPFIMTFHVQLAWRNWMVVQLDSGETESINPPDFGKGLTMLAMQNNLMWLPSVPNIPLLLNLSLFPEADCWSRPRPCSSACRRSTTSSSTGNITCRRNSPGGTRGSSRSRPCCA